MFLAEKCQYTQGKRRNGQWNKNTLGEREVTTKQNFKERMMCVLAKESKVQSGLIGQQIL